MGIFSRRKPVIKSIPVTQMRQALLNDKAVFLAIIVDLIKKHRKTLENKLEECKDEDDYGNSLVDARFKNEITYFSDRVVLPELERCVEDGRTKYKDVTLILSDITILADRECMPMDISYEDSDQAIVGKLLLATNQGGEDSLITDDMLLRKVRSDIAVNDELKSIAEILIRIPLIEPYFGEGVESSRPMDVSRFAASVFMIFSTMYNNQVRTNQKNPHQQKTFISNDPYKYEEYVKELLRGAGFQAKRTRGSGDYGVDVIASRGSVTYAIQCKLYNHTVGTKAVQEVVSGRIFYRADYAIVVSDNSFTPAAKNLARKSDVILTHHNSLLHKMDELHAEKMPTHKGPGGQPDIRKNEVDNEQPADDEVAKESERMETDELITVVLPVIQNDK